jgi:ATP-dependent DNA helicase 2 subunit 1
LFSNIALEIGPNFKISVNGYLLFKRQEPSRSCYVWLGGEKPQIAQGVTTLTADDTARAVEKPEIRKAYKFGDEQISFTPEEQQSLRNFGDPVIRIIGFKPLSALPFWANMKHPTFIYPSEEDYVGSTRVFSALHQKLLKDSKMALVWFIPRKNAAPVLGAMMAGAEKTDEHGTQKFPPGMWILPLPFADDVRQNPETGLNVAPEPLIDRMRDVIQQLQLPKAVYDPTKYPNPCKSARQHYGTCAGRLTLVRSPPMALPHPASPRIGRRSPRAARRQNDTQVPANRQGEHPPHDGNPLQAPR